MVGAELERLIASRVDSHQRTSVPGLYAAGDVVIGLDQISRTMGEGGSPNNHPQRSLREDPRWRESTEEMEQAEGGARRGIQGSCARP